MGPLLDPLTRFPLFALLTQRGLMLNHVGTAIFISLIDDLLVTWLQQQLIRRLPARFHDTNQNEISRIAEHAISSWRQQEYCFARNTRNQGIRIIGMDDHASVVQATVRVIKDRMEHHRNQFINRAHHQNLILAAAALNFAAVPN
jgi:ribonucleotide reductase beta subunit family protein with ferritin-like domain